MRLWRFHNEVRGSLLQRLVLCCQEAVFALSDFLAFCIRVLRDSLFPLEVLDFWNPLEGSFVFSVVVAYRNIPYFRALRMVPSQPEIRMVRQVELRLHRCSLLAG